MFTTKAEEVIHRGVRFVLLKHEGDWYALRASLKSPYFMFQGKLKDVAKERAERAIDEYQRVHHEKSFDEDHRTNRQVS